MGKETGSGAKLCLSSDAATSCAVMCIGGQVRLGTINRSSSRLYDQLISILSELLDSKAGWPSGVSPRAARTATINHIVDQDKKDSDGRSACPNQIRYLLFVLNQNELEFDGRRLHRCTIGLHVSN